MILFLQTVSLSETWRTGGQREASLNVKELVAQFNVLRGVVDQQRAVWQHETKMREENRETTKHETT